MKKRLTVTLSSLLITALLFGAGCWSRQTSTTDEGFDAALAAMSPEEATKEITFSSGTSFTIWQYAVPFEGGVLTGESGYSSRDVEIASFARTPGIEFAWDLTQYVETDESRAAREAIEEGTEPPERKYSELLSSGTVRNADLVKSHKMTLPVAWTAEDAVLRSSAVWVSDDVFVELSRTRNSTLYLEPLEAVRLATLGQERMQSFINTLREHVLEISARVDVDFFKAEGDIVEWPLRVNGTDVMVQAIRARNWYGEIVVLNNRENPLVLKFDFNPSVEGVESGSEEMNALRGLLNFEVTDISL